MSTAAAPHELSDWSWPFCWKASLSGAVIEATSLILYMAVLIVSTLRWMKNWHLSSHNDREKNFNRIGLFSQTNLSQLQEGSSLYSPGLVYSPLSCRTKFSRRIILVFTRIGSFSSGPLWFYTLVLTICTSLPLLSRWRPSMSTIITNRFRSSNDSSWSHVAIGRLVLSATLFLLHW